MSKKETASVSRRDFFRRAGLGAGAVGVTAVGLAASKAKAATPAKTSPKGAGYQETDHVRKYYESARF